MFWDTVCLSIPIHPAFIKPSVWLRLRHPGSLSNISHRYAVNVLPNISYAKLLLTPNLDPISTDVHYPSITLVKQQGWWNVWIEGSMPKFLFGTNLFELDETDQHALVMKIYHFLYQQGLVVEIKDIRRAILHKLDVSKILLVPPHAPLVKILEYLKKMDFDMRNEVHYKEFRNLRDGGKGLSLSFGTKTKKFLSLYDKLEEVANNSKKSQTEKDLLTFTWENIGSTYQLLKYEESLFDKTRLDKICNKLTGQKKEYYTFVDLWDKELIRKILLYHGEYLFHSKDTKILLLGNGTQSEIQETLLTNFPNMRASRLSQTAHWVSVINELGLKGAKKRLNKDYTKSTRYRILKDTREVISKAEHLPMQEVFDDLYKQLQNMKPIRTTNDLLLPFLQCYTSDGQTLPNNDSPL